MRMILMKLVVLESIHRRRTTRHQSMDTQFLCVLKKKSGEEAFGSVQPCRVEEQRTTTGACAPWMTQFRGSFRMFFMKTSSGLCLPIRLCAP
mmetsp:Transcript_5879/g.8303  ORF Transcript_5879/g.8303 Transcript_5879/m.8303 type:complete len:92 (-) Transcript_5879:125-400(-)